MRMPPPYSDRKPLTETEIATAARLDRTGREMADRTGPSSRRVRPALPAVRDAAWVRNPIDRFILARLEREGSRALARSRSRAPAAPRHAST